jgi:hypothetical protein
MWSLKACDIHGEKKWSHNGMKVMLVMHRFTIGPNMWLMIEDYFRHLGSYV